LAHDWGEVAGPSTSRAGLRVEAIAPEPPLQGGPRDEIYVSNKILV